MNIIEYSKAHSAQTEQLVQLVIAGTLTADEAAQSLAGWDLKHNPNLIREMERASETWQKELIYDSLMMRCHVAIDTRLPDFDGLVPGRHL